MSAAAQLLTNEQIQRLKEAAYAIRRIAQGCLPAAESDELVRLSGDAIRIAEAADRRRAAFERGFA